MRAVIQRVDTAMVTINNESVATVGRGIVALVGITHSDTHDDCLWIARKLLESKIFPDESGKMALNLLEVGGELLLVSQMTLYGSLKKGRRPSFNEVAPPDTALPLYNHLVEILKEQLGDKLKTGVFGAMMKVHLINNGPVTFVLDSKNPW